MKHLRAIMIPCLLISALTVFLFSAGAAEARVTRASNQAQGTHTGACGGWSVVKSPDLSKSGDTALAAVAAVSSSDVWAVGESDPSTSSIAATLTMHWDGSQWSIISSPNVGPFSNAFLGVAAVASNNVWAVGYAIDANHVAQTLIEQWNGTSWNVVSSPNASTSYNTLYGVSALSASDVWAVGYAQNASGAFQTLIEHWNGTAWSIVTSPNPGVSNNYLFGVKALATNDVLAVGQALGIGGPDQSLVEQWNGSAWSVVSTPPTSDSGTLYGVTATTTNAWAVGMQASNTAGTQPLAQQTVKGRWNTVSIPGVGTFDNNLYGAVAVSDSDVWAVGTFIDSSGNAQTLIEQWNGTSWNVVSSPSPGSGDNILGGVAALSANNVWAVGGYDNGTGTLSLIEHYC